MDDAYEAASLNVTASYTPCRNTTSTRHPSCLLSTISRAKRTRLGWFPSQSIRLGLMGRLWVADAGTQA
eukprot:2273288-Rhodomonas_salina.1